MGHVWTRATLVFALLLPLLAGNPSVAHADAASPWTAGPDATGDDTYAGFIDSPISGTTLTPQAPVVIEGWVVDRTAVGWTGIDRVEIYLGLRDQGGSLMVQASIGQPRSDVAASLGNAYWTNSGFTATFSQASLTGGSNLLVVYAHTPAKGWRYQQLQVNVPAPPARAYADDPLLIVREATPSLDVAQTTPTLSLTGYAIDRNLPADLQLGAGGSGVSSVQAYLDGPRTPGNGKGSLVATASLAQKNREATGFGERFLMSGFEIDIHPADLSVDRHVLYIYADSAYWPNETLVVIPFTIH
jgi:hypothetical protein